MQFAELVTVKHRVQVGVPLPFSVRHADTTLLLARGQQIDSDEQMQALFARGALVDLAELRSPRDQMRDAPREQLPALWGGCLTRVSEVLLDAGKQGFVSALNDACGPVYELIARDPDLAIFQVLRQSGSDDMAYGAHRSIQTAITGSLVAQRMGWTGAPVELVFKVGLTSNISMLELQGQLATQTGALNAQQQQQCRSHPVESVRILEQAGINDADWLQAVLGHHEREDGTGYPSGRADSGEVAALVRRADIYTSKLASRSSREALGADLAGRQMFIQDAGSPLTAALVKEFGMYPPGCLVRLVSGEVALVVGRGETISTPMVSCLTTASGTILKKPVRVSAAERGRGVASVVGDGALGKPLSIHSLHAALAA